MSRNIHQKECDKLMAKANKLISRAEEIATEHNCELSMDIAYGMGGWFASGEWKASSESC